MSVTRRTILRTGAATAALLPFAGQLRAEGKQINVFAHRVMQNVSNGTKGGDVTQAFTKATGDTVNWVTFETGPLHDRLFREASLSESTVDVAFILNTYATPRIATLFEPLGPRMAKDPVEDPKDLFPGLVKGVTIGDELYAVPFRHASTGLHYNEEIFAERGIKGPPQTIEEFVEVAKKCTYTRPDGTPVVGFILPGVAYPEVIALARAWDADFITPDMKVVANSKEMVAALTMIRDLYTSGAVPKNLTGMKAEDANTWMQQGRAAMAASSMSRNGLYNDPAKSQVAGKIKTTFFPIAEALKGKYEVAPTKVEFWSMAIPKNSKNKDLAWAFIKAMSSKDATLAAALNGNGPVRSSTYDDPRIKEALPYADAERKVLQVSRVPLPAFDNAARAADLFKEQAETVVLGMKTPQQAMDELTVNVQKLIG
ncbi:Multiple sugar transport system substrate-binding protein [Hyphomicrobiales bacterium]|nr:Multiple sugar transport system substrate-binding protein [Hyphomicrobiales bacterium]CAH1680643.1 Multiple sugar transport system substrate-binding protein [Hyphomicrobiales bacterium]